MAEMYGDYESILLRGDRLCKIWETPLIFEKMVRIQKIYEQCQLIGYPGGDKPLIIASRLGFDHLVWGFIYCAVVTKRNLHTRKTGELQEFLDMATEDNYVYLLNVLKLKKLQQLFDDPEYDGIIFKVMKEAAIQEVHPSTSTWIHEDKQQEMEISKLEKIDYGQHESALNRNTILHLISEFKYGHDPKPIIEKNLSHICSRNHQGETPFYVGARDGNVEFLKILMSYVRMEGDIEALATRSLDKHTALHIAIENHHVETVSWLVNEIPQLANCINDFNESPLYLASQRRYHHILRLILDECEERSLKGPNGKTALHAAVMSLESVDSTSVSRFECIMSLLQGNIDLLRIHDLNGWAPLHYAAYHNITEAAIKLLEADPDIGYLMTEGNDVNTSAIHIAATQGHWQLMEVLMEKCPRSFHIIDSQRRNILHVAIENKKADIVRKLFENKRFRALINQRDSNGNTPLHLFMASDIEIREMVMDRGINIYAVNNQNLTALDMASSVENRQILIKAVATGIWNNVPTISSSPEVSPVLNSSDSEKSSDSENEDKTSREMIDKLGDSFVVVIALIATATFAAAFAVPGGFDGNEGSKQGMPILLKKIAYKVFVASNAFAFSCSCCVLFSYMRLQMYILRTYILDKHKEKQQEEEEEEEILESIANILWLQYLLTRIAMIAMAVAFFTGSYCILEPSLAFAISLCATCVCIIVSLSFFPTKYLWGFAKVVLEVIWYLRDKVIPTGKIRPPDDCGYKRQLGLLCCQPRIERSSSNRDNSVV